MDFLINIHMYVVSKIANHPKLQIPLEIIDLLKKTLKRLKNGRLWSLLKRKKHEKLNEFTNCRGVLPRGGKG